MTFLHSNLASGRWQQLSLLEQLGNIGSEVGRAARAEHKDEKAFNAAVERAIELFDLTLEDSRWQLSRKQEIARAREVFCDAIYGGNLYGTRLADLTSYFDQFALAARLQ